MNLAASNPAFVAYVIASLILVVHSVGLWAYSGLVRGKTKTAINDEDAKKFGAALVPDHPPEVARVLRAHANAVANANPFYVVGLLLVIVGGSYHFAAITFGLFVALRCLYMIMYLGSLQPWRTITYTGALLVLVAMMIDVVVLLVRA